MSGQANRNSSSNCYDSLLENSLPLDASVIITGYEKPWLDRSAICLDAGSDTDHEKIENNETAVQDQDNETRRFSFTSLKNDSVIENSMTIDKSIIITQYEKPWADRSAIDLEPDCYSEQCVVKTTESNTTPSDVQQAKRNREKDIPVNTNTQTMKMVAVEKVKNDQEVTHPFIGKDENHVDTDQEAAKQSIGPEARHTCIVQDTKRIDTDQEAAKQSNGPEARHTCIALDAKRIDTDQAMKLNIDQEAMKLNIDQEAIKLNIDQEAIKLNTDQEAMKLNIDQEAMRPNIDHEAMKLNIVKEAMKLNIDQKAIKLNIDQEAMQLNIDHEAMKLNIDQKAIKLSIDQETMQLNIDHEAMKLNIDQELGHQYAVLNAKRTYNVLKAKNQVEDLETLIDIGRGAKQPHVRNRLKKVVKQNKVMVE